MGKRKYSLERPRADIGTKEQTQEPTYWGGLMNEVVVRPNQEPVVISPKISRAYAQEDAARETVMKQAGDMTRNIHSATNKAAPILGNVLLGAQTAPLTIGLEAINQINPTAGAIASLLPLGPTAIKGIAGAGKRILGARINYIYNKLPWTYRIPEHSNMAYRRMGPLERDWLMDGNELSTRETNPLTLVEEEAALTDPKYNFTTKNGITFNFFKAGAEHGGRKQFAKGQPWGGTTVTHGEEQVLAIPGKDLPWVSGRHYRGPQGHGYKVGKVPFEEAPLGSHIDLLTKEGYTGVNPSLLDGSIIYSPFKIFGHNFGYKKLYPRNTTSQITAENDYIFKQGGKIKKNKMSLETIKARP